jgi:hypothetical protein
VERRWRSSWPRAARHRQPAVALSRGRGGGQRKKKGGARDCCEISKTLGTSL